MKNDLVFSSTQRSDICKRLWIFVFFAKNIGKNVNKNSSGKYSQKHLVTDALKTNSKRVFQKTAQATDDLVGNKVINSQQNNSETVTNENDKKIPKER